MIVAFRLVLPDTADFPLIGALGLDVLDGDTGDLEPRHRPVRIHSLVKVSAPFTIGVGRVIWSRS